MCAVPSQRVVPSKRAVPLASGAVGVMTPGAVAVGGFSLQFGSAARGGGSAGTCDTLSREARLKVFVEPDDVPLQEERVAHLAHAQQVLVGLERAHAFHLHQPGHRDGGGASAA
jgi:hypothetical protein